MEVKAIMIAEKIAFAILATYLIITIFFKFIKKIDRVYITVLALELLRHSYGISRNNIYNKLSINC